MQACPSEKKPHINRKKAIERKCISHFSGVLQKKSVFFTSVRILEKSSKILAGGNSRLLVPCKYLRASAAKGLKVRRGPMDPAQ